MEPKIICRSFNLIEAQIIKSRLEAAGFHPELKEEFASLNEGFSSVFGGVKVIVPDTEEAEAKEFLAADDAP